MRRLTRPARDASNAERMAYYSKITEALTELGVRHGDDFIVDVAPTAVSIDAPLPSRRYDGATTDASDVDRLDAQMERVRDVMSDGRWRVPDEITAATGDDWASVSARLRDLRKEKFGSYRVEREHVEGGLWRYRVLPPVADEQPSAMFELPVAVGKPQTSPYSTED